MRAGTAALLLLCPALAAGFGKVLPAEGKGGKSKTGEFINVCEGPTDSHPENRVVKKMWAVPLTCALQKGASDTFMDSMWDSVQPKCQKQCQHEKTCIPACANNAYANTFKVIQSYLGRDLGRPGSDNRIKSIGGLCSTMFDLLARNKPICGEKYTVVGGDASMEGSNAVGGHDVCIGQPDGPLPGGHRRLRGKTNRVEATINCEKKAAGYANKKYKAGDLLAVLDICSTPCMKDSHRPRRQCCKVPTRVASMFGPCPDCPGAGRRLQGAGASTSIAIAVESGTQSLSVYDRLVLCLADPASVNCNNSTATGGR